MIYEKKVDPRVKLITVFSISSMAVFIRDLYVLSAVLTITILVSAWFGANPLRAVQKLRKLMGLIIMIALMQSIFSPSGIGLIRLGLISVLTTGGLLKGIEFVLRMMIIVISASIIATSNSREMVQGLIQWKIPYEIAFMVFIGIRFLPILTEEIKDTFVAIQLRGIQLDRIPMKKKLAVYTYIFTPVIAGALIKAKKLSTALETKAFRAYPERTSYKILEMTILDYTVIAGSILIAVSIFTAYQYIS